MSLLGKGRENEAISLTPGRDEGSQHEGRGAVTVASPEVKAVSTVD